MYLSRQKGRTNLISKFISLIYNVQIFRHMARGPASLLLLWASQMPEMGMIPAWGAGLFKEQMTGHPVHKPGLSLSSHLHGGLRELFLSPVNTCKKRKWRKWFQVWYRQPHRDLPSTCTMRKRSAVTVTTHRWCPDSSLNTVVNQISPFASGTIDFFSGLL